MKGVQSLSEDCPAASEERGTIGAEKAAFLAFVCKISDFMMRYWLKIVNFATNYIDMKAYGLLFLAQLSLLTACGGKNTFTLEGKLEGLTTDTLFLYYITPEYRFDTLVAKQGKIELTLRPDTLSIFRLLLDNGERIPIIVEKGKKATVKGNNRLFVLKGEGENNLLGEMLYALKKREVANLPVKAAVDTFIRSHPRSYANVCLIDEFYAHDSAPDYKHIVELIESLSGNVQDTRYLSDLLAKAKESEKREKAYVDLLREPDSNGKYIDFHTLRDRYVLLSFWASWDRQSVEEQDSLASVIQELRKEKFTAVSVSLDLDRKAWTDAIGQRDTVQWKQVCDFKGWKGNLAAQVGLSTLPTHFLLDKTRRIVDRHIAREAIVRKVRELTKQDKENETQRKRLLRNR